MFSYVAVVVLVLAGISPSQSQDPPDVTRKIGPPICALNSVDGTLNMTFVAQLNEDDITFIGGCKLDETTQKYYIVPCDFDVFEIDGILYMEVKSQVNLDDPSDSAALNPCGVTPIQTGPDTWNYQYRLAMRRLEGHLFYGDMDYLFSCNPSLSVDTFVSTGLDTRYDHLVQPIDTLIPDVMLTVVDESFSDVTFCVVDQHLRLKLVMRLDEYEDFRYPNGLYSWNTFAGGYMGSIQHQLLGSDGCTVTSNPYGMSGDGFVFNEFESTPTEAVYYTSTFSCARFWETDQLWFSTLIRMCSGQRLDMVLNPNDMCHNFCAYSNGRKRRQASGAEDVGDKEIYAVVTVREETVKPEKGGMSKTVLIAITVSVVVLVVALLFIFGGFLWYTSKQLKTRKTRSGSYRDSLDSSRASSDRKLPIKF